MGEKAREDLGKKAWKTEEYHRGIKQLLVWKNAMEKKYAKP
jgi:hypothetical protein